MPPITGTFEADFSQFSTATKDAENDLKAFQATATTATASVTKLETATTKSVPGISNLTSSYSKFDGALNAVGIHIGPQVKALEDIGSAAGVTAGQMGLLASAGLVVSTAMAAWKVGTWIGEVTGWTKQIQEGTATLLGFGDVANETALAVDQSIVLAFQRTHIWAKNGAEALQLNTEWAKKNQTAAKDGAKAHQEWADAMVELNSAGKGWQGTLETIDGETVNAIKYYLDAGVSQGALAKAYALTDTQVKAISSSLAAEKKAIEDVAAARALHDSELMISYNKQIGLIAEIEKARSQHYGLDAQVGMLQELAANEEKATKATYAQLDSEKDRMKLIEANAARQKEIEIDIAALRDEKMKQMAASTLEAVKAQTELNNIYGRDAAGAIKQPIDALETYRRKVAELNGTLPEGIELTTKLALASAQLQQGLLAEAQATDVATTATKANNDAKQASVQTAAQIASARANAAGGTGKLGEITQGNTDPQILNYMGQGYTLNEAMAIVGGYGASVIGANAKRAAAGIRLPGMAAGGPVAAGTSYVVGELGPEVFTPAVAGAITPNGPAAGGRGGGGVQIIVQGSVLATQSELADLVQQAMISAYRRGGNRLPA